MEARFLFAELERAVTSAAPEDLPALIGRLEAAKAAAWVRLSVPAAAPAARREEPTFEGNISAEEAARRLGVSKSWVYKNAGLLPFIVRIGRRVVCSASGVERWNLRRAALPSNGVS